MPITALCPFFSNTDDASIAHVLDRVARALNDGEDNAEAHPQDEDEHAQEHTAVFDERLHEQEEHAQEHDDAVVEEKFEEDLHGQEERAQEHDDAAFEDIFEERLHEQEERTQEHDDAVVEDFF